MQIAETMVKICRDLELPYVFKASFDKANRTSKSSFRGLGIDEGLRQLEKVSTELGVPVTTDVHESEQCAAVAEVCDLLQIPAFLARQTDLLVAAAETGKAVNIKKGQFMAPADMQFARDKVVSSGNLNVLLCERGTFFGYGRLVNDMQSIPIMQLLGSPVIFDATHSVQTPGGSNAAGAGITGGNRDMVIPLARAAIAMGANGIFCETRPDPASSPSDAANMLEISTMQTTLTQWKTMWETIRSFDP
jgi:2-dehydro-3-deoxyphosphooctonate aldolase (KDO 8-P synthase)